MKKKATKSPGGGVNPRLDTVLVSDAATPSGTQPSAPAASAPATVVQPAFGTIAAAITAYQSGDKVPRATLTDSLPVMTPGESAHHYKVHTAQENAISKITAFMRKYPTVVGDVSADQIDAGYDDMQACTSLSQENLVFDTQVKDSRVLSAESTWAACSSVLQVARIKARQNKVMGLDLATIDAALKSGPRDETAPVVAVKKQTAADHTAAMAEASQTAATAANARAATAVAKRRAASAAPATPTGASGTGSGTPPTGNGTPGTSGTH